MRSGAVAPELVINTSHAEQSDLQIFGNFEYDRSMFRNL